MVDPLEVADVPTPIGIFRIVYQGPHVRVVDLLEKGVHQTGVPPGAVRRKPPFPAASPPRQLSEYFRGIRTDFAVEVDPDTSSAFDRAVWTQLRTVTAGRTTTYGELARKSGFPGSARAVGGAMARNPIPIIIPCHRVIGTGGAITGFGLGLWRKRWLLDHEGAWPIRSWSAEGPRGRAQRTLDSAWKGPDSPASARKATTTDSS
ncbi:MAG TPA: methylated-DNA--[protein]-cysteine S-methyltransferase [Thermoplasmata archaeon]|nr:methylated-DNA--[protein]-cysteine S-methyltransferase [Thermoplasmata archaeon]